MVYRIRPFADHANFEIDLEYQKSPTAQGSWFEFVENEKPVPKEHAPILILSERATPLPDAFEINQDFWCVSARVREMMENLFGSQVAFYEVPVVVKATNVSLPPTHFVTFSQFRSSIDWQKSKVTVSESSPSTPDIKVIALADARGAAVFKVMPNDREMIWIERMFRQGNRLFMPGFHVYATNAAARSMSEAFPESFILTEFEERPAPVGSAQQ
jgi:hypothetical protein